MNSNNTSSSYGDKLDSTREVSRTHLANGIVVATAHPVRFVRASTLLADRDGADENENAPAFEVDWVYVDELAFDLTPDLPGGPAEYFVHAELRDYLTELLDDEVGL